MNPRLPAVLLTALALAAPGATSYGKDKPKDKDKKEQKSSDRGDDDRRGDRDDDGDGRDNQRGGKITICHVPPGNRSARHTISVSESAWSAHQGHGDRRGACVRGGTNHGDRFDVLDTNDDGVIGLREWRGERAAFLRLDRDDNRVLSRDEFFARF